MPESTIDALVAWQQNAAERLKGPRTHPADFHLTLLFLGNVQRYQLPDIESVGATTFDPFQLRLSGLAAFGEAGVPRVVFGALAESPPELLRLQRALETNASPWIEKPDPRGFNPHVTLLRVARSHGFRLRRDGVRFGPEEYASWSTNPPPPWTVSRFELLETVPKAKPAYRTIASYDAG